MKQVISLLVILQLCGTISCSPTLDLVGDVVKTLIPGQHQKSGYKGGTNPSNTTSGNNGGQIAGLPYLKMQKAIYDLLWYTDDPKVAKKLNYDGVSYDIEANIHKYENKIWVKEFLALYKKGLLPMNRSFGFIRSVYLYQAKALFKLFYTAKDFDTLCKTASWAKVYVNRYMFSYTFGVAIYQRPDTKDMRIPATHENFPNACFFYQVMQKARDALKYAYATHDTDNDWVNIIQADFPNLDNLRFFSKDDAVMSYFTEDINLGIYGQLLHAARPPWLSSKEFPLIPSDRGNRYFNDYRQQHIRHYLERLSNDLDEVEDFSWDQPIKFSYQATTAFQRTNPLPHREPYSKIPSYNYDLVKALKEWENRFSIAIDMDVYIGVNGTYVPFHTEDCLEVLGNLIEGNADSPSPYVYGSYDETARVVLGFSPDPGDEDIVIPSVLEYYGLDQRDSMYWSLLKRILKLYERFVSKLPRNTLEALSFPGVRIKSVDVGNLTTYFTPIDYYISNAVKLYAAENTPVIKARQYRLTHHPYTFVLHVQSDKKAKASIRIFLGPKYNFLEASVDVSEYWNRFMVLDEWVVDLQVGDNVIKRNSHDAYVGVLQGLSGDLFYKRVVKAIEGKEPFVKPLIPFAFPERLTIPKGKEGGFAYQLYIYIGPCDGKKPFANKLPAFPLDRPVIPEFASLDNGFFKTLEIYHVNKPQ